MMVSRDLTCDETMPPLDEGDQMIGVRIVRTNTTSIAQNNLHSSIPIRNSNDVFSSSLIGSSRPLLINNEITQDESQITVREVVNRQIRNSKLKKDANLEKIGILTSQLTEFDGPIKKQSRHTNGNSRMASGTLKNQIAVKNEIIVPQSTTIIAEPNFVSLNHKTNINNNNSTILNCHQLPIGSHLVRFTSNEINNTAAIIQPVFKEQTQISNGHWAQHPPDSSFQNQQLQYNSTAPKKVTITRTVLLPEQPAITSTTTSPASIIVHHQANACSYPIVMPPIEGGTKVLLVNEQQTSSIPNNQQNSTTPHSSPRPSILRNSLRRLADRPASASGICDTFGNGQTRIVNCASQGGEDLNGGEDSPRKKPRKQYFGDTTQPDKLMMEVYANQHQGQSISAGQSIKEQSSIIADQPTTSNIHFSISSPKKAQSAKKRGRPKNNNTSKSVQSTHQNHHFDITISRPVHQPSVASTGIIKESVQSPRVMVEVDSILQDSIVKKRKYKKRQLDADPKTGEIIKKERKKGSGRKSKRDEKAALQQKESAILAGIGITTNNHQNLIVKPSTSSASQNHDQQQNLFKLHPQSLRQQSQQSQEEQDVIRALCRFRRDSEQREVKEKTQKTLTQKRSTSGIVAEQNEKFKQTKIAKKNDQIAIKASPLPLLGDLRNLNLGDLRAMLKNCDRALDSADNTHLLESYNELINLLSPNSSSSEETIQCRKMSINNANGAMSEDIYSRASCSVFSSYAELKSSKNYLRLLPKAMGYFDASQRLLHSIRTNLLGHSIYYQKKGKNNDFDHKVEKEETTRLISVSKLYLKDGNNEALNGKTEKLHRFLLERISTNLEDSTSITNEYSSGENFLLQLEVAQTLDLMIDRVVRNQKNSENNHNQVKNDYAKKIEMGFPKAMENPLSFYFSKPINNNLMERIPKFCWELFKSEKRKLLKLKRRYDEEEDAQNLEEEKVPSANPIDEEEVDEIARIRHRKQMLESIWMIFEGAQHNLDQLEKLQCKFNSLVEQFSEGDADEINVWKNSSATLQFKLATSKLDIQMKKNPHKSCQFLFRPPSLIIGELLKDIADCSEKEFDGNFGILKIEKSPSTSGINIGGQKSNKEKPGQGDEQEIEESQSASLVMQDLDELLMNSRHISNSALDVLKLKYVDKLVGERHFFEFETFDSADVSEPFKPSIQTTFPPDSGPGEQREFLKVQMRQVQEVYKTTANLMQSRLEIAKECADCLQEIYEGKSDSERSLSQNPVQKSDELEHRQCDTPESPSIPNKRKAHWRALSNIQSTSRATSMSRGSMEMMDIG